MRTSQTLLHNRPHHRIERPVHGLILESQEAESQFFDMSLSPFVISFFPCMCHSVNLNDEVCFETAEIYNEMSNGELSSKFVSEELAVPKCTPHHALGGVLRSAELFRARECLW